MKVKDCKDNHLTAKVVHIYFYFALIRDQWNCVRLAYSPGAEGFLWEKNNVKLKLHRSLPLGVQYHQKKPSRKIPSANVIMAPNVMGTPKFFENIKIKTNTLNIMTFMIYFSTKYCKWEVWYILKQFCKFLLYFWPLEAQFCADFLLFCWFTCKIKIWFHFSTSKTYLMFRLMV